MIHLRLWLHIGVTLLICVYSSQASSQLNGIRQIVNSGLEAWEIIKGNHPVLVADLPTANALPDDEASWQSLHSWSTQSHRPERITVQNRLGQTILSLDLKVVYSFDGTITGNEHYLTNVRVVPEHLHVAWGYRAEATVEFSEPINVGTSTEVVAGLEFTVKMQLSSLAESNVYSRSYQLTGEGEFMEL